MSWTDARGNGRLQQLVIESRKLSRRRQGIEDLLAADTLVTRGSCGAWHWPTTPCTTCSKLAEL